MITCTPKAKEKYWGTWINPSGVGTYKLAFFPDGTGTYRNKDGSITGESRVVITKKWTDVEGNTWFMTNEKWNMAPYKELGSELHYALMKIDPSGNTMERDVSRDAPLKEFFGPAGTGVHQIYQRQ